MPGADAGITRSLASIYAITPHANHPSRPDHRQNADDREPDTPDQGGLHETERDEAASVSQILHVIPFVKRSGFTRTPAVEV